MEIKDGTILIPLDHIERGLQIVFKDRHERFYISKDYLTYNESQFQFSEGVYYAYKLFLEKDNKRIESPWAIDLSQGLEGVFNPFSKSDTTEGSFVPNTFVGSLRISLMKADKSAHFYIEVQSSKIDYRDKENVQNKLGQFRSEYQLMLEEIVEHSMDLIMQYNVPIEQTYESGVEQISDKELYQRFIFVRSLFKNQEFEEAVQKIISNPATKWDIEVEARDVRSIRRFTPKNIRELVSGPNRMNLSTPIGNFVSIPAKISSNRKVESVDTPENRFIKHILTGFQDFCESILPKLAKAKLTRESEEVQSFSQRLDNLLNQTFFKEINRPNSLKLNSPVLQRRSGYRELLRAWLRFHVTAQLSWNFDNDDNLFTGGKKDIASLYEYWVFFVLFKTLTEKYGDFSKKSPKDWVEGLIVPDSNGLGLTLQEGRTRAFEFNYMQGKRPLTIKFYYNRTFPGGKIYSKDKRAGSYSKSFRPDYTLSIWPSELKDTEAEEKESIVHIHFDAKYKVDYSFFKEDKPKDEEEASGIIETTEKEERQGNYKNVDLYKMHAYKDAIRRSGGAYILYPGTSNEEPPYRGFHEIIPGVGAFAVRPSNEGEASENIKKFIDQVIENLEDVLSQRELLAKRKFEIMRDKPITEKLIDEELFAVAREIGVSENIHDTYVLVGYCKQDSSHYNWITEKNKYNIRFGEGYEVDGKMASAKFLILYELKGGEVQFKNDALYRLSSKQTRLISKEDLFDKEGYPTPPSEEQYLLYSMEETIQLGDSKFDFGSLHKGEFSRKMPFVVSLEMLLRTRIK
jgi:predicted component of viral defense system (DUF524 family)